MILTVYQTTLLLLLIFFDSPQAVCGLALKPKEDPIAEIDLADVDNELAAVEYVEDMYKFYKLAEVALQANTYSRMHIRATHI